MHTPKIKVYGNVRDYGLDTSRNLQRREVGICQSVHMLQYLGWNTLSIQVKDPSLPDFSDLGQSFK